MILYHESKATLSIPDHRELAPGLVRGLIRKAGLSVDEFLEKSKSGSCRLSLERQGKLRGEHGRKLRKL